MKRIPRLALLGFFCILTAAPVMSFDQGNFLNFALFHLPPEQFAEIPLEDRGALIQELTSDPKNPAIYYEGNYFEHLVRKPGGDSVTHLWIKLLPRETTHRRFNSDLPLVYIHRAKSVRAPSDAEDRQISYHTAVLQWNQRSGSWDDMTTPVMPDSVDLNSHLPPHAGFPGIRVAHRGLGSEPFGDNEVLIWENKKLTLKTAYPTSSSYKWDAPFDPDRLAVLAFRAIHDPDNRDNRELAQLIVRAGMRNDERFRVLIDQPELRALPLLSYALASYEYALDKNDKALDFMLQKVAEEGNGDTNAKWMLHYFDEWDRTIETYRKFDGRDGAAAEASAGFYTDRKHFYPENFEKYWKKKHAEIEARQ